MHAAPLYDAPFHPVDQNMRFDWRGKIAPARTRTEDPVEYYILDFSRAVVRDQPGALPSEALAPTAAPVQQDLAVRPDPDGKSDDGFANDVYCLGTWIRDDFLKVCRPALRVSIMSKNRTPGD